MHAIGMKIEKAPVFLVNHDNALTFPQLQLNDFVLRSLMGMQFIYSEQTSAVLSDPLSCSPLPDLKDCMNRMMQEKEECFTFSDPFCLTICNGEGSEACI